MSNEPSKRRSPRWRRLLRALPVLLVLALVVQATLRTPGARRWLTARVEAAAEQALGEDVTIGDVWVQPLRASVRVEGLVVRSRRSGRLLLGLDRARARLGLGLDGVRLRVLELRGPVVDLAFRDGVLVDLPGLAPDPDAPPAEPLERLPWDELLVRGLDLRLSFYEGEATAPMATLRVEGLDLQPDLRPPRVDLTVARVGVQVGDRHDEAEDIRVFGAILGPDRLVVPALALESRLLRLQGHLDAELDGALGGALSLRLDPAVLSEWMGPGLDLEGEVFVDLVPGGTLASPSVELAVSAAPALVAWSDDRSAAARYEIGAVTVSATARPEGLDVDALVARWGGGRVEGEGRIGWDGALTGGVLRGDDLSFATVFTQVGQTPAPWVDFRADLELSVAGTLSPLDLRGPVEVVGRDLRVAAGPHDRTEPILAMDRLALLGELDVSGEGVTIEGQRLSGDGTRGRVSAWLGFAATPGRPPLDVRFDLFDADLQDFAPLGGAELGGRGRLTGSVVGPYGSPVIEGRVDVKDFTCVGVPWGETFSARVESRDLVHLDLRDIEATTGATTLKGELTLAFEEELGLDTRVIVEQGRLSDVLGMFVDLPGVEAGLSATLTLSGPVEALDGEARLRLTRPELYGERFEAGEALGLMRAGRFTLDHLRITRWGGAEALLARGSVGEGWAMNLDVLADGLRLERLDAWGGSASAPRGSLSLSARVGGTLFEPAPEGRLTVHELRQNGEFLADLRLDFDTRFPTVRLEGGLVDGSVQVEGGWRAFGDQGYALGFVLREAPLHVLRPTLAGGEPVLALASAEGRVEGLLGDGGSLRLEAVASQTTLRWGPHALTNPEPWRVRVDGDALRTEGLRLAGGQTDLVLAAMRSPDGYALVTGGGAFDLDLIEIFTGESLRGEGVATARLALGGPLDALDGQVQVSTQDATFRSEVFPHPFERVSATLRGSATGYEIVEVRGEVGGGPARVVGGVTAEGWVPTRYDLRVEVIDARVRYLDDLPPMVGDAALALSGPPEALLLSGELVIDELVFSERLDWERWAVDFREQRLVGILGTADVPDGLLDLDLRVHAPGTVRVRNNLADGQASAELRVIGDSARPGMIGDVRMLPGGRFFYEDRDFDITRAELHYNDPYSFDPELDFVLETDIRTAERSVHIVMPVSGPFSNWRADPRSEPALPQGDINALILFGVTREEIEQLGGAGSAIAMEGLDLLLTGEGQRALDRLGGAVLQNTKVDLLTGVSSRGTQLSSDWRVLVERDVPEPWELTFIGEFNPFRLDDQYLAVERQLTGNVYLNLFWTSYQRERDLAIGGAYGADFRVRWEVD